MEIYLDLRDKIEDRIEEIENYYELNFDKPNSQYFEKGRMKLKKLLIILILLIMRIKKIY